MTYKDLFKSKKGKEAASQETKQPDAPKPAPAASPEEATAAPKS